MWPRVVHAIAKCGDSEVHVVTYGVIRAGVVLA